MPNKTDAIRPSQLELELDLALQTHRSLFETLHAEVRKARANCNKVRKSLVRWRGPSRVGAYYRIPSTRPPGTERGLPIRERMTTLPMGCLG